MNQDSALTIGVFDSGIGGLTAVRELERLLPTATIIYLGDTARLPYGTKSNDTILRYTVEGVTYLLEHYDVTALLIACNTASAVAASFLRQHLSIPVFDVIDPAAQQAAQQTQTKTVLITGTYATIENRAYERSLAQYDPAIRTLSVPCPLFVPLAEEGLSEHPIAHQAARLYLERFAASTADTVILGCTHFPLLTAVIRRVLPEMHIINSGAAAAYALARTVAPQPPPMQRSGELHVVVTDLPRQFPAIAERFLGHSIDSLRVESNLQTAVSDVLQP